MSKILRTLMYTLLMGAFIASVSSCKDDENQVDGSLGTVSGTVTEETTNNPIADVQVKISAPSETDIVVTTGADGKFTAPNVTIKAHSITFSKTGFLSTSKSITANSFDANKTVTLNAVLVNASSKITGTVTDAKNANAPLAGVAVTVGAAGSATTGADGKYTIENLVSANYTVSFTKANYVTITKNITATDFASGTATVDANMGAQEVLRGLTAAQLTTAPKWYYNEYRGGRNSDSYPHFDWACNYMATLEFVGAWEEQNEGTTLQIRNTEVDRANPADLNVFDSYVYGSKMITADNKIMSVRLRTHGGAANPATYGVQVIDMSAASPTAVKIGDNLTYASDDYADVTFDLSNYVGKEVIIAIGTYRAATGDFYRQLVLRAIRFANAKVSGTGDWLPGTEVVAGWKLTKETVASTTPQTKKSFTGISPKSGDRDAYVEAYKSWRAANHVGAEWSFVPLKKDPEVFPSEGYLIKTRATNEVSSTVPEAYLYAKFAIAAGKNQLTFTTRNFSSTNFTYFKVSAVEDNGTVTNLTPKSNTATTASAGPDGTYKFKHEAGGAGDPEGYAAFVYDLSGFNGKNVTIVIGVYNVDPDTGENKLVFHTIDLN